MKQEDKKPEDFAIIEKAIMWLVDRYPEQVSPNDLAEWLGMSPFALQKCLVDGPELVQKSLYNI